MSRNTQGGLGHRLRGRRGGNARHRHQLSSSGGGSRTGEMGRRERGERGESGKARTEWGEDSASSTPQSSRARKEERSRAGRRRPGREKRKHRGRELSQRVWEGGTGDASIYSQGAGPVDVTDGRAAAREGRGPLPPGNVGGAEEEGSPALRGDPSEGRGPLGLAGAGRPAGRFPPSRGPARRSPAGCLTRKAGPRARCPPDRRARPRPCGACAPR